jgi:hypothetical protein
MVDGVAGVLTFLLAFVFGIAGVRKLHSGERFEAALRELVAPAAVPALKVTVPLCEVALAVFLLGGWALSMAAAAAIALLLVLSAGSIRLGRAGWSGGCGCFGESATELDHRFELARNGVLLVAAGALVVLPGTAGPWSGGPAEVAGRAALAFALIVAWIGAGRLARRVSGTRRRNATSGVDMRRRTGAHVLGWDASTRRRLLQGAGAGALAFAGSRLAWPVEDAQAALLPNCWAPKDVQVCYRPWRVVTPEPGHSGVLIRKGPSFSAPVLTGGHGLEEIPVGYHFGRQSARIGNPCGTAPGPRAQASGWLWISGNSSDLVGGPPPGDHKRKSGWVPFSVGGTTYAVPDGGWLGTTCGPCCDFDCRHPQAPHASPCTGYNGCSSAGQGSVTDAFVYRTILDNGDLDNSEWYTIRYARDSVPIFWLVPGDVVLVGAYKTIHEVNGPRGEGDYTWACIQIGCGQWAPNACGGWIRSEILGADTDPYACRSAIPCPG